MCSASGELFGQLDDNGVEKCLSCPFEPMIVHNVEEYVRNDEILCTFVDKDDCILSFVYGNKRSTGELQVWVQERKECPEIGERMSESKDVGVNGGAIDTIILGISSAVLLVFTIV